MEISTQQIALATGAYVIAVNIGSAIALWLDKRRAATGQRRISEQALLVWALVGGWPLGIWVMRRIRHKTSKRSFQVQYVTAIVLNVAGVAAIVFFTVQK